MHFTDFFSAHWTILWASFAISLVMGAVVNKTNFCTMGAVSDWVNMGDTGRLRAWLLAATTAMLGVIILEALGVFELQSSLPPYRANMYDAVANTYQFPWGRFVLGGLMFGVGMTLASGCGNKTLIRIGGGNLKSIFVFSVIGIIAYYMVDPYKQLEAGTWYQNYFDPWLKYLSFNLSSSQQDLGSLVRGGEGMSAITLRLIIGLVMAGALLVFIFRSADYRSNFDNILSGLVIGLAVIAAWYVTTKVMITVDGSNVSLASFYVDQWDLVMPADAVKPQNGSTNLLPTSLTFISPIGQVYGYVMSGLSKSYLTFGVMSVLGVLAGSLLWSLISRGFRIEWFASVKDFVMHVFGAVLMGFGGVLGLGCTVGQAITGVSTLALGSLLTFLCIVIGSAVTMKIQLWLLMRE